MSGTRLPQDLHLILPMYQQKALSSPLDLTVAHPHPFAIFHRRSRQWGRAHLLLHPLIRRASLTHQARNHELSRTKPPSSDVAIPIWTKRRARKWPKPQAEMGRFPNRRLLHMARASTATDITKVRTACRAIREGQAQTRSQVVTTKETRQIDCPPSPPRLMWNRIHPSLTAQVLCFHLQRSKSIQLQTWQPAPP